MGDVVPFIARVRSSGDWTAAERARLEELAERLSGGGPRVEAIFGATDEGDPWCVVTDENGEVLIHVARIDGRFVVHSAADDALSEGADLHAALRERLNAAGDDEADRSTVVPFSLAGRQAQTFLALLVAAAFFYETVGIAPSAEDAAGQVAAAAEGEPPPPPLDLETPTQERELAVQGAALTDPAPQTPVAGLLATLAPAAAPPAAAASPPEPPPAMASAPLAPARETGAEPILLARAEERVVTGTSGDDVLVGGAADERILGGDGDDTLLGGGGLDTLDGGAGADRIELAAGVTAVGGEGADTFVITAPPVLGRPDTLLGVISDFDGAGGDVLVTFDGREVVVPRPRPEPAEPGVDPPDADGPGVTSLMPTRINVDIDEDGVVDGYVLVGQAPRAGGSTESQDAAVEIVGRSLPPPDVAG